MHDPTAPQMYATSSSAERNWAMLAHLSAFTFLVSGIGSIVGPLVVWLIKKEEMPFVDYHGKESLNFQISILIYSIISGVLIIVLIGIPMLVAVLLFDVVMTIIAAIKASNGEYYRYPLTIRLIK